ncbi:hypothetical protein ABE096_12760 [Robertmurraya massiliosenegalensis]
MGYEKNPRGRTFATKRLTSTILAKSVALEKTEEQLVKIHDKLYTLALFA